MRILLVNKFFYLRGGSERYFFELKKLLESHGHEVICFSMKDEKNFPSPQSDFFVANVDFASRRGFFSNIKKAGHSLYSPEARRKMEALIKKYRPEVAHLHNISHQLSPSILSILKEYKIPTIQTLHDYQLICPNYKLFTEGAVCERCRRHRYYEAVIHKCIKESYVASAWGALEMAIHKSLQIYERVLKYYVSPSVFLAKKLEKWGYPPGKTKVVNNFIDLAGYEPNYGNRGYLLYFGRLAEEKGLPILLKAIKGLPEVNLKIAGAGPEEQRIKKIIIKEKIENVEMVGFKTGQELAELIKNSIGVVMPSLWYENYPYSILESFAYGKPVVASDLGGIPELVKENITGLLFTAGDFSELRDKIKSLYSQPRLAEEMGRRARKLAEEQNNPEDHYQKIIFIYEELRKKYGKPGETNKKHF
ncbi:MAG: glycosyltransferase [Patescibacteria group bacterium]|nr:glycosyltransferase [Patescibacteria group bacterium]MDD5490745.1 glycosyltransferase [Patescibacteria group bacterium]